MQHFSELTSPACPIRLKKGVEARVSSGFPWIYADDIVDSSQGLLVPAGSVVNIESQRGQHIGIGYYNPASQIACRVLALGKEVIDVGFFRRKLENALFLREKAISAPYYRLLHSESDFLPGLLIDRFAGHFVAQAGTAGMDRLKPVWIQALNEVLAPSSLLLRHDVAVRTREGLTETVELVQGELPELVEVHEHGCIYLADLRRGQKTGWFYDQRDNRALMASYAKGKSFIDIFSHSGGFGLRAALGGACEVSMVDSSKLALSLAADAAKRNKLGDNLTYLQGDAFDVMQQLAAEGKKYDVVCADPPAFVKQKKDIGAGMKGYEKVARLAGSLVAPGGMLFVASCSHHASRQKFNQAVVNGAKSGGFEGRIIKQTGAAPDHPLHKLLQQNEYLKGVLLA